MAYMEWTQDLAVGQPQIDEEHRSLVAAVNDLHAALDQGRDRQEIERILVFLRGYVVRHFEQEETLMIRHRFPGAPGHFAAHAELVLRVSDLLAALRSGREVLTEAVLAFLGTWLREHFQGQDQVFGDYLRAKGVVD
jgi:hemerythrin-like metal-binding protein